MAKKGFTPLESPAIYGEDDINKVLIPYRKGGVKAPSFLKGFTLIELMLVVIIIGVLVAMVMPRLAGRSEQARIAAARAGIEANIALALDLFELDMGRYPTTEEGLSSLRQYSGSDKDNWKGPYLKKTPKDPWGREYKYKCPGTHNNDYDLYSLGPNGIEGDDDDIKNWE